MATRYSIAEQVSLKLYGGSPKVSSPVQMEDIMSAVGQECNTLLKAQHFTDMSLGENAPPNLMLMTYPKVTLTTYGGKRAKCTLPAVPVHLIRNQGIWMVSISEFFDCLLIPVMSGQWDLLRGQEIISDLMGQAGYEVNGLDIITTKDLTIDNVDGLYFRLLVTDIAMLSDFSLLPLPADLESVVINNLYQKFAPTPTPVRVVDAYAANP